MHAGYGCVRALRISGSGVSTNPVYTKEGDVIKKAYGVFDVYDSFIDSMTSFASSSGITFKVITYDWRLEYETLLANGAQTGSNISYLISTSTPYITQELKRLAASSKTGKVTIIAHSNGGLLAKALLSDPTYVQYVDKLVMVAVPQLGTPQTVAALLHGAGQGLPVAFFPFTSVPPQSRSVAVNTPGAYNLLPSNAYFSSVTTPVITFDSRTMPAEAAKYGSAITSGAQLTAFLGDTDRTKPGFFDILTPEILNETMLTNASSTHAALDAWTPPTGVEVYAIAGWGEKTMSTVRYRNVRHCGFINGGANIGCENRLITGYDHVIDGDGTVVEPSALYANGSTSTKRYWVNLDEYNKIGTFSLPGFLSKKHPDLLSIPQLNTLFLAIITATSSNISLPQYVSIAVPTTTVSGNRLDFTLHSPLTLGFLDSSGNYTGATTTGATSTLFNVPGVIYEIYGEEQFLSVPKSLSGKIVMQGTGSGGFTLDVKETSGNTTVASTSFEGIPNATSTKVILNVSSTSPVTASSTLTVDFDGNGTTDLSLPAAQGTSTSISAYPEVQLQIKSSDFSVKVVGSSTVITFSNYAVISNAVGTRAGITFDKTTNASSSLTSLSLTGISYNALATTSPQASSTITYLYSTTTASTTLYQQRLTIGSTTVATSTYNPTSNTSYVESDDHGTHYQYTWTGLKILRLITDNGVVRWMFGS